MRKMRHVRTIIQQPFLFRLIHFIPADSAVHSQQLFIFLECRQPVLAVGFAQLTPNVSAAGFLYFDLDPFVFEYGDQFIQLGRPLLAVT